MARRDGTWFERSTLNTGFADNVHFTSSDSAATLPADATLTTGTGTLRATFNTVGTQKKKISTQTKPKDGGSCQHGAHPG